MVRVLELLDWIRQRKSERREGARANGEGREGSTGQGNEYMGISQVSS